MAERASFDVSRPTRERRSPPLVRTHGIIRCRVPRSSQKCRNITQSEVQFSQAVLPPTRGVYPSHVKKFLGSFAYSFITPRNVACALFHGLFTGSTSRVALTCTPFEWERVTGEALLDVIQNLFTHHGSDPSLSQKKTILVPNIPWSLSVNSQSKASKLSCLRRALVVLISSLASANVMPVSPMFLLLQLFGSIREATKVLCLRG